MPPKIVAPRSKTAVVVAIEIVATPPSSFSLFPLKLMLLEVQSSSTLILVGTFIDENIETFYNFLDNVALD